MENIIKVDINDNEIGQIEKLQAHRTPILHRAFSVFLYDNKKILIQQRALGKYHSGGLWANSCCSHPRPNKTILESVYDRVDVELGITEKLQYKEIFNFTYLSKYAENLYEYEFDHVFVAPYKEQIVKFNTEEIMSVKWIDIQQLKKELVESPEKYATWFIICVPKVIAYIEANS